MRANRKRTPTLLAALCLSLLLRTVSAHAQSEIEKQLIDLEKQIDRAYVAADAATLEKIFAPDYTIVDADAHVTTGTQELARLKSGQLRVTASKLADVRVRPLGDTAIVSGHLTNSGAAEGNAFSSDERLMDIWVRRDGHWQLVASQSTAFEKTDALAHDREARAAIAKLDQSFVDAFNKGNAAGLATLYTSDAQLFAPQINVARGAPAIRELWNKYLSAGDRPKLSHTLLEVQLHEDVAHVAGTFTAVGNDGTLRGKYLLLLQPENGEWKIYREIWNSDPLDKQP